MRIALAVPALRKRSIPRSSRWLVERRYVSDDEALVSVVRLLGKSVLICSDAVHGRHSIYLRGRAFLPGNEQ